jgi:hypothetical protein
MPGPSTLPVAGSTAAGVLHAAQEFVQFNSAEPKPLARWTGVNAETALMAIVSSERVQEATSLDRQGLLRRFAQQWSPDSALRECELFTSNCMRYSIDFCIHSRRAPFEF